MVEIPIWVLGCFTFAIYVLFMMHLEAQDKIRKMHLQTIVNAQLVSNSFQEIAVDIDLINNIVNKLEAEYDHKKAEISKASSR